MARNTISIEKETLLDMAHDPRALEMRSNLVGELIDQGYPLDVIDSDGKPYRTFHTGASFKDWFSKLS